MIVTLGSVNPQPILRLTRECQDSCMLKVRQIAPILAASRRWSLTRTHSLPRCGTDLTAHAHAYRRVGLLRGPTRYRDVVLTSLPSQNFFA
jgi:hypothetical protein